MQTATPRPSDLFVRTFSYSFGDIAESLECRNEPEDTVTWLKQMASLGVLQCPSPIDDESLLGGEAIIRFIEGTTEASCLRIKDAAMSRFRAPLSPVE